MPEPTAPAAPTEIRTGRQRLVLADCLAGMAMLDAGSIDVVVTSPPYNIGIRYGQHHDRLPREAYLDWMGEVAQAIGRVLAPEGSLFLNVGGTGVDPWIPMDVAGAFRRHLVLQNDIAWIKSVSLGDATHGHFKPVNSPRFLNNTHEKVYHFSKTGAVPLDRLAAGVPYMDKSNVTRWEGAGRDRRCAGNSWFVPYVTVRSKRQKFDHPAGFPLELPERCLKLHGGADLLVMDPFLGAGTTLLAAERAGHRGVGFEIDPDYLEKARQRLERISELAAHPPFARGPSGATKHTGG